jgi:DNA (cytosine-5)-methyltransferase 1
MKYLSVCSGIEAASVAWHSLGWSPVAFSEIDAFPCAVLAHHYPSVPNWGDMTHFREWPDAAIDILVGGTPCQSFSVAGLRKGLADPRGNLTLTYLAITDRYRPEWLVWENVPGVLSDATRAFGAFLGGLGQLGYGFAYRILDAQYFGVAQRRRRVFVVGHARDWRRAAAVLFERASLRGDSAPSRETRKGIAAGTLRGADGGSDVDHARAEHLIPAVAACLDTNSNDYSRAEQFNVVAFDTTQATHPANHSNPQPGDPCHPSVACTSCRFCRGTRPTTTRDT